MATEPTISSLYHLVITNRATQEELRAFLALASLPENEQELFALMDGSWQEAEMIASLREQHRHSSRRPLIHRIGWWRVAAVLILLAGIGTYFILSNQQTEQHIVAKAKLADVAAPDRSKAIIQLADGKEVPIDEAVQGTIASDGDVTIRRNADGTIKYQPGTANVITYNTAINPRGSSVAVIELADGSRIWLNAGSSVKYPTAMTGKERKLELTGEAYFEVTHNPSQPFLVRNIDKDVTVEVLGTRFNMNTYADESSAKVTLLQGSVKVSNSNKSAVIKPGEQAEVTANIRTHAGVDIEEVMAWKDGRFYFNEASTQEIMKQVSRWYNMDISYQGQIPERHFNGKPSRSSSLASVLKILELQKIRFRIEEPPTAGKAGKITVMP